MKTHLHKNHDIIDSKIYNNKDFEEIINVYQNENNPNSRYSSFDYCYNYFIKNSNSPKHLTHDMEKSCLVLGFYLSSWGMFRGSSFLLNKSIKHFEPTIRFISDLNSSFWKIDVDNYDKNEDKIMKVYTGIRCKLFESKKTTHLTLVTKVMLGVFGFIPAFDQNFGNTFRKIFKGKCGFRSVNNNSLCSIHEFYKSNNKIIDKISDNTFTIDYKKSELNKIVYTKTNYPKAKIIDMYGFTMGKN